MFLSKMSLILMIFSPLLFGYSFTMQIDNAQAMVGETIHLTTHFRYNNLEEYDLAEPDYENFKLALVDENETQDQNNSWLLTQHYTLIAQKAGSFTLHPLKAHIESIPLAYQARYNKNHYLQKQDIFTQSLTLNVTPLPQGLQVTGNYTLEASIDKNKSTPNSPVQFTLTLTGKGNLESLDFLSLHIPHTTIYEKSSQPKIKTFSILSNQDYTIPPIVLKYFNQNSKTVMLTSTPSYAIHILGTAPSHSLLWLFVLLLTTISSYGFRIFYKHIYLTSNRRFIRQLKKCKSSEDLVKKIAPYIGKDRGLTRLIYRLETCKNEEFKKIKKEIIKHWKNL